jgi:hypothetical protein
MKKLSSVRSSLLGSLLLASVLGLSGCSKDSDNDGIPDKVEGDRDTDGDGIPDTDDPDSDDDGINDVDEGQGDLDGDGVADFQDNDDDGDGLPTAIEGLDDIDNDGIPNYQDLDSDSDTIQDQDEGGFDSDNDGITNSLDNDSDDDGIADIFEAGDADLGTSPIDSDGDGQPNFRDPDSDNDSLLDADEDLNQNGVLDPGESSPLSGDTDTDGVPDIVEVVAGTDPQDPNSQIPAGDFFFVLPFFGPQQTGVIDFSSSLRQADIFFSVDTTGSFQQEIDAITAALSQIQAQIRAQVPDVAFGVGRFEDYPRDPFGLSSDAPFGLLQRITTDDAAVQTAVSALGPAAGGLDVPEAGFEALFQWGSGVGSAAFAISPFDPLQGFDASLGHGTRGGAGFRDGSLPIILQVGDAASHTDYPASFGAHNRDQTLFALEQLGARIIGIDSLENVGTAFDPRAELEDLAISTNTLIPPVNNLCATGVNNGTHTPDPNTGLCPLVFDVNPDGTGLGDLITQAIIDLVSLGTLDVNGVPVGDPALLPTLDTSNFIKSIVPVAPAPNGSTISGDFFLDVPSGAQVLFELTALNDFVPGTQEIQLFQLDIHVLGDLVTVLDVRRVFVIVPPEIPPIQ